MAETVIIIPRKQTEPVRAIYSPESSKLLAALGTPEVRRASNVEPSAELSDTAIAWLVKEQPSPRSFAAIPPTIELNPDYITGLRQSLPQHVWWADLLRSGGPVLGPLQTRDEGIAAELAWLAEHNYPTCQSCATDPKPLPTLIALPTNHHVLEDGSWLIENTDGSITRRVVNHHVLEDGSWLIENTDGSITRRVGCVDETRDQSHPEFYSWRQQLVAAKLTR